MKTVSKWSVFQSSVTVMLTVVFALASAWFAGAAQTNYTWNVSTPLSTSAWNANGNWLANGSLTYGFPGDGGDTADTVTFGNIGTNNNNSTTPNNVVTANTTISTLLYTNILSTSWHVMDIQSGITLTVTNMTVGVFGNPMTNATENANVTDVAMVDAGTLFVCSNLFVGCEGSNSAPADSTLNMLGLSNFVMNASAGTLQIGVGPRSAANVDLANQSNYIQVATFSDNIVSSSSSVTGNLQLGGGTNIIYASTFSIAGNRGNSTVSFPAGSTGGLLVRGTAGTTASLCNLTVGNRNNSGGSGNNGIGTLSFVGHPVNLYLSTLTMGESGSNPSGAAPGTGTLSFDTGTVYASNVIMAVSSGSTVGVNANGIINVGSTGNTANPPTLFIGSGGMSLVNMTGSTAGTALGMLNITNAMIFCSNSVVQTTISGTGVVNVATGGNLYMVGGTVGTAAIPINTVKITSGTLVLSNTVGSATANVYSTNVIASSGTIIITNIGGTIPSFSTTTIPLINYSGGGAASPAGGLTLVMNPAITNSLAGAVLATLHDSGTQIQLQFTPTAAPPPLAIWTGATNGDWDYTTTNWAVAGTPTNYADGDLVQFDDTLLSNNVINLTTTLNPAQTTVSNANENYTFNGTGSVTNGALIKLGTDSLILDNSGANTFTSVAITNGTVQIGNGDNLGSLGSGSVSDSGSLVLDRTDTSLNLGGTISGPGSVVDNGSGGSVVTLSANNNSFNGGLTLQSGTLIAAVGGSISATAGTINFNGGTLEYGVSAIATNTTDYSSRFSTAASQQYNIDLPTSIGNPAYASVQVTFASALTSSGGTLTKTGGGELIFTATNTYTGGITVNGGMVRANNTNAYGANTITEAATSTEIYFNVGSWTYPNNLNIQGYGAPETDTPANTTLGAIRIAGTGANLAGTITLTGNAGICPRSANPAMISGKITDGSNDYGIQFGHTSTSASAGSGTLILSNTADSWHGDTTIADGTLKLGASEVIPNGSGFGNLVMTNAGTGFIAGIANSVFDLNGYNETVNGLSNAVGVTGATLNMLWVTNDGATASTLVVGDNNANGNFGGIIGNGASALSLAKIGTGAQVLSGANTYTGSTTVSAGSLALVGSGSIANSPNIIVAGGATLDVSGLTTPFTLGASQTLSNSTVSTVINGTNNISGALSLVYDGVHPSFIISSNGMNLSGGTALTINNTGAALGVGAYTIITNANSGFVTGTVPASFTVGGSGIAAGTTNALQINNGTLQLVVTWNTSPAVITGISISGTTLTLNATNGAPYAQYMLMGTTNLTPPVVWTPVFTNNFDMNGNINNLMLNVINPNNSLEFYILQMP